MPCQSCSMPLEKPDDFGTNADSTINKEYCRFCFQNGAFTEPNITLNDMADKFSHFMIAKVSIPEEKAYEIAKAAISPLKRWKMSY